jgi:hypothetical protein
VLDGRPWTPGAAEVLTRFLTSPDYAALSTGHSAEGPAQPTGGLQSA